MTEESKIVVCLGAGYVGGCTMAVIASKCPEVKVCVVDVDKAKIEAWSSGTPPIHEPGLDELVKVAINRNLSFSTNAPEWISKADMIFIAVGTPTKTEGVGAGRAPNTQYVEDAARMIGQYAKPSAIVVQKSTVPPRFALRVKEIVRESGKELQVLANPEFLAEGTAVKNLLEPDRTVIGRDPTPEGEAAANELVWIYRHWQPNGRFELMDQVSAELCKLAANAFLAQRLSSTNAMAHVCERLGGDARAMFRAVGADARIGPRFLYPGIGFGGSCFQKDILNLSDMCEQLGLPEHAEYWTQIVSMNDRGKQLFVDGVVARLNGVGGVELAVWGFAFKANSGDTRESPAISVCLKLGGLGAKLRIFDPRVPRAQIERDLSKMRGEYRIVDSEAEAAKGARAILLLTEWQQFQQVDWDALHGAMLPDPVVFDARNMLKHREIRSKGFRIFGIGIADNF